MSGSGFVIRSLTAMASGGQTTIEIEKDSLHDRREFADRIGDPHSSVFLMKRTEPDSFTFHEEGELTLKFQSKN